MSKWDDYGTHDPDAPWNREHPRAFNDNKKKKCPNMPSGKHRYVHIKGENCGWTLYKIGSQYRYTWSRRTYVRKDNWIYYDCQCFKQCRECGFSPKYGKRVACATVWDQAEQPSVDDTWRFKEINGRPQ